MATYQHVLQTLWLAMGVAAGGALGTLFRWGVQSTWPVFFGAVPFFIPTLVVNVVGCVLMGVLGGLRPYWPWLRHDTGWAWLATGFLGGLTTFSTLGIEMVRLMSSPTNDGYPWPMVAAGYGLGSLLLGVLGVGLGMGLGSWLGRHFFTGQ
jgi:CrcB protein